MIRFDEIDVIFDDFGLLADSASINSSNSLEKYYSIGYYEGLQFPNGPINNQINIDYTLKLGETGVFEFINKVKQNVSGIRPVRFEIGGLYGLGYLTNITMNGQEHSDISCSLSMDCYTPLSGILESKRGVINYLKDEDRIPHFWTTFFSTNTSLYPSIYQFSYDLTISWNPIYLIGRKNPHQILLNEVQENVTFVADSYIPIDFSGMSLLDKSILLNNPNSLQFNGLSYLWNPNSSLSLSFDLRDMDINSITSSFPVNDYAKFTVNATKYY